MIYSLLVDDVPSDAPRWETRKKIDEVLNKPFSLEELREYELDRAVRANIATMEQLGDRYAAKPLPPRPPAPRPTP